MSASEPTDSYQITQKRVIELAIRLGFIFVLISWCFVIVEPFILIVAWGVIVAIALHPVFDKLAAGIGGREKVAATLLSLLLVAILVVPVIMLTESLIYAAGVLAEAGEAGDLKIMPPPESVAGWPLIGEQAFDLWQRAAKDLAAVLTEFTPQIKAVGAWLLDTITGTGLGVLQFIVSFVIAGVLLTTARKGTQAAAAFATRLAGVGRGTEFAALATGTIRNVALGIVGVSILQTALLSLGFLAIGLPAAGLAAFVVLVLCIIQIGPTLVTLPAIIYVVSTADTLPAVIFTVWTVVMSVIDSVLKPLVFGRGASVPTLVIFLGAIGGMLAYGIIGLFLGAVVLSLGFKLYEAWLAETPMVDATSSSSAAAD